MTNHDMLDNTNTVLSRQDQAYAQAQFLRLKHRVERLGKFIANRGPTLVVKTEIGLVQKSLDAIRQTFGV